MSRLEVGPYEPRGVAAEPNLDRGARCLCGDGQGFGRGSTGDLDGDKRARLCRLQAFPPFIERPLAQPTSATEGRDALSAPLLFRKQGAPPCPVFWFLLTHSSSLPPKSPQHKMWFTERSRLLDIYSSCNNGGDGT